MPDHSADFDKYRRQLSSPEPEIRSSAASRLRWLEDSRAVEPLIHALEDEEPRVRAAVALALLGFEAPESVPALLDHLAHDKHDQTRAMCAFALGCIGTNAAMDGLVAALPDTDWHVRTAACSAFACKKDKRATDQIMNLLDDPNFFTRHAACDTLVILEAVDERVVKVIEELIASPEGAEHDEGMRGAEVLVRTLIEHPEEIGHAAECMGNPMSELAEIGARETLEMAREKIEMDGGWPEVDDYSLQGLLERARRVYECS